MCNRGCESVFKHNIGASVYAWFNNSRHIKVGNGTNGTSCKINKQDPGRVSICESSSSSSH